MFTEKLEREDLDKVDPEYLDLIRRVMVIQADCEIGGPHLYVEHMLDDAPTRVDRLVVARTAAEEIDHYRKFARIAHDVGADASHCLSHGNQKRYVEAFRGLITTWEDFAVFGFLIDRVGKYQLEEYVDCSYAPLDRILPPMLLEEEGHIDYGTQRCFDWARAGGEKKERIQKSINYWYVKGLDMFGKSVSPRSERYRYWGLKRRTNAQARAEYLADVNPLIEQMGLHIPDPTVGRQYF